MTRLQRVFHRAATDADTLVIALHGCRWLSRARAGELREVIASIRQAAPTADVLAPLLPIEFWSLQDADEVIKQLLADVDAVWREREATGAPYRHVLLVGLRCCHS